MKNISINKLKDFIGKEVQLNGWIYNLRSVGKIWFAIVRDGTGFVQCVVTSNDVSSDVFELESSLYRNDIINIDIIKPVFITGLARSGTTILLRNLYASNQFSSTTYEDMPFILCPNLWSKFNFHNETSC